MLFGFICSKHTIMKYLSGIILAFLMSSCTTQQMNSNNQTIEGKWELSSINGEEINSEKLLTLTLGENNQLYGYFGCNQVNGTYTINGNSMSTSQLSSTRMMCDEQAMAYERTVLNALENKQSMQRDENEMKLNTGDTQLTFNRIGNTAVVGRYWKLLELDGEKVTFAENQEKEQFMIFKTGDKVYGFTGCNYFNGSFELEGDNEISFDQNMATTMMACQDIDESKYLQVFKNAETYKVSNNKLYLYNQGNTLAVFEDVLF
ncbi:META domain-containing protein [Flavobacteriaceae bacterium Ap0902]|nr:META domain-containing protein [Flavobacteriaceae bacterium Ap0902]